MDQLEFRAGLVQLIEHWGRSGISHLAKPSAGCLTEQQLAELRSAGWLASPSALPAAATTPGAQTAQAPIAPKPQSKTATPSPAAAPKQVAAEVNAADKLSPARTKFAPQVPQSQPTQWELPSLPVADRSQCMMQLAKEVAACTKCPELVRNRSRTVFGVGNLTPRVCFFGEAPGADEDRRGEPFVGAAGQLLDKIIAASQMRRQDVYILNTLKCRPPENRTPEEGEISNCRPFFEQQLQWLQPEYIVCLGAVAVRAVLQTTDSIGRLRGKFHAYQGAKVLATYHPAYLLRNESAKKLAWEDMKFLMRDMGLTPPPVKK